MSICFKREAMFNCVFFFYLRFADPGNPSIFIDVVQMISVLWIIQNVNASEYVTNHGCLWEKDLVYLKITNWIFQFLLWFYTVIAFCVMILFLGLVVYSIIERIYLRPRRRRDSGANAAGVWEFEKGGV